MTESFTDRFNRRYGEKIEQAALDYSEKNVKLDAYVREVRELASLLKDAVKGTEIKVEEEKAAVTKRIDLKNEERIELPVIRLSLDGLFIKFVPDGMDYRTGAARLGIEHNNEREKPLSIDIFLRSKPGAGEDEIARYQWQVKIGYRNFKPFDRKLIEGLIETVFLS